MYGFEVTRNRKKQKGVKLINLQNGYLGFFIFFDFETQTQNYDFLYINPFKIQDFQLSYINSIFNIHNIYSSEMHISYEGKSKQQANKI